MNHNSDKKIIEELNRKLSDSDKKLKDQNEFNEKQVVEFADSKKELISQNEENEKINAALIVANIELTFQNEEKAKRAAELLVINNNKELQNDERIKRAAEIVKLADDVRFLENQQFEKTLMAIGDGVISIDKNKNILFLNRVAEELTGWLKNEAIGHPVYTVFNIINEFTRSRNEDFVEKVIISKRVQRLANHTILISKDGTERIIEDSAAPILNRDHTISGVVIVFRDCSEKVEKIRKIEYLNFHDDHTGLYNRRFFEEELLRLDTERNLPLSIIMGDINGLKLINDSFGHLIGDELLKISAESIQKACRKGEIVARIGGDEFAVVLPNTNATQAEVLINRIKSNLSKQKVVGMEVSVSFGVGCKNHSDQVINLVLKESEDRMYRHKLFESLSMRSKTVELISKTLFEKNGRELLHSKRVSNLCELLAIRMNFDLDHIAVLKTTGLMHDIGKIAIEQSVLNKNGRLSVDEYNEIKKHPEIGYRILSSVSEFSEIAIHVLQHHEGWDGSGYPKGLKGEEISLDARIITLADAYDAITSYRTYRKTRNKDQAIKEIEKCLGTQFDPIIGRLFIELINENPNL